MGQLKRLISQYFVSFSLNRLLFVYNFAVISNGMPNITELFRLPTSGRNCRGLYVDRCSVNLVVIPQTLENKY